MVGRREAWEVWLWKLHGFYPGITSKWFWCMEFFLGLQVHSPKNLDWGFPISTCSNTTSCFHTHSPDLVQYYISLNAQGGSWDDGVFMWWRCNITLQRLPIALRIKQKLLNKTDRTLNSLAPAHLSCFITCTTLSSSPIFSEPGLLSAPCTPCEVPCHRAFAYTLPSAYKTTCSLSPFSLT